MNIYNLPSKFSPYLLTSEAQHSFSKFNEVNKEFTKNNRHTLAKNNKRGRLEDDRHKKWLFQDLHSPYATDLYGIRKAIKIKDYIEKKCAADHFHVPCKYLYCNKQNKEIYIASEKIALSNEVGKPASAEIKLYLSEEPDFFINIGRQWRALRTGRPKSGDDIGKQRHALRSGNPERALTPIQAETLAELAIYVGYTDLSYNNLYFTPDGKVAIINTEPVNRILKKLVKKHEIIYWLGDVGIIETRQALIGIAKLKQVCSKPEALQKVNKVEQKYVLWFLAKLVGKIALAILVIYFIPTAFALLPLRGWALTCLQAILKTIAVLKTISLTLCIIYIYKVWQWSHQGVSGMKKIDKMEKLDVKINSFFWLGVHFVPQ
jgi:hypothetical protein